MNPPILDFWFDFASTYSYPSALRLGPLAAAAGVRIKFRPFLLGAIFKAQGWTTSPFNIYSAKGEYMWRDVERICRDLSLPFCRPDPFPQNSLLAARVALVGLNDEWGEQFCIDIFRAQFAQGRPIDDRGTVAEILAGLNIDAEPVLAAALTEQTKALLRSQTEEAQHRGLFGAPSFTTSDGEVFWGNDRLERALLWATRGY